MQTGSTEQVLRYRSVQFEGRLHVMTVQRINNGWVIRLRPWGVNAPARFEVNSRSLVEGVRHLDRRIAEGST